MIGSTVDAEKAGWPNTVLLAFMAVAMTIARTSAAWGSYAIRAAGLVIAAVGAAYLTGAA
jgi:hypothetical protein